MHYLAMDYDDWRILKFEHELGGLPRWRKQAAIRRDLGITETRYLQRLAHVVELPDAVSQFPQVVYMIRGRLERRAAEADGRLISRDS